MRQVVLDTETTGLKPEDGHRIIEIGCIELVNRKITGKNFHHYINPERDIDINAMKVHGIDKEFLSDKPLFKEVMDPLLDFISGAELIIHNAPFDIGFLEHEFKASEVKKVKKISEVCGVIDTLVIARKLHPGQKNSLDALCKRYNVDNSQREYHGALLDAEILALVYLAMTGGQTSLFEQVLDSSRDQPQPLHRISKNNNQSSPLLDATLEELAEHEAFLELIKKKAGKTIWE